MRHAWKSEDDLAALPDNDMGHELVAGVIVEEPLPSWLHDQVRQTLEEILNRFVRERGLGKVRGECGYLLSRNPDTVRGPDLSFVRRERLAGVDTKKFFRGAPDLAVEILSPSNRSGEMKSKVADYLAAGCRLVWVIDPETKSATTYRSLDTPRHVGSDGALGGEDLLPGLTVRLDAIFEEQRPSR